MIVINQIPFLLVNRYLASSGLEEKWKSKVKGFDALVFSPNSIDVKQNSLKDSLMGEVCERIIENNMQSDRQNKQGSVLFVSVSYRRSIVFCTFYRTPCGAST